MHIEGQLIHTKSQCTWYHRYAGYSLITLYPYQYFQVLATLPDRSVVLVEPELSADRQTYIVMTREQLNSFENVQPGVTQSREERREQYVQSSYAR